MANFTASVTFESPQGQFLVGGALNLTQTRIQHYSKDTLYGNIYLAANQSQSIYTPSDSGASVAPTTFVFAQASAANSNDVAVLYKTGSNTVQIGTLSPGDWMYLPMAKGPLASSSIAVQAGATAANVAVLYAESGSL